MHEANLIGLKRRRQNLIITGDYNNHLSENKDQKKISKYNIKDLKNNQPVQPVIYRIIFPKITEYTFFSNTQVFTKIDHNSGP